MSDCATLLKHAVTITLLLCAGALAHGGVAAGELTLYGRDNFGGREVTLRDAAPDLRALGFDDRAASLIVRGGRWEVCTQAAFRGRCMVFGRGEYRALRGFDDVIASVRELGTGLTPNGWPRAALAPGMIELFARPALGGNSTRLLRDVNDLVQIGFNNRAASVVVEAGTWQLCGEAVYRGQCVVLTPGRYDLLAFGLAGKVSSARLLPAGGPLPAPQPERSVRPRFADGEVELFSNTDFGGVRVPVNQDVRALHEVDFNDRIGSIIVHGGRWEFCVNPGFRGQCVIYGPGRYTHLGAMHEAISSLRRVP